MRIDLLMEALPIIFIVTGVIICVVGLLRKIAEKE